MKISEKERKYLIENISEKIEADLDHIVFQWYLNKSEHHSEKIKTIFDITRKKIICVRVKKYHEVLGVNEKEIEYLKPKDINVEELIGKPFILKRRAIIGNTYIDHFIRSNGKTKYLLEIEDDVEKIDNIVILSDVTENSEFYNENMCALFEKDDCIKYKFLIDCWEL